MPRHHIATTSHYRRPAMAACAVILFIATACERTQQPAGGETPLSEGALLTTPSARPTEPMEPLPPIPDVTLRGSFVISEDGTEMTIRCWGEGEPVVILEAGYGLRGTEQFAGSSRFVGRIAAETRVCAYDRLDTGGSADAPADDGDRTADSIVAETQALLRAAGVEPPYVLAAPSYGGFVATYFARKYPDDVLGVVLLDVPAPSPRNAAIESRFVEDATPFEAPLTVITATDGISGPEDQAYWLDHSVDAEQLTLEGGHSIYEDQADACAREVLEIVEAARQ